jgi:hypothetical protein
MHDRQIIDNIVLVQEVIHSSYEAREEGMLIKLDMVNSFDCVRNYFLFKVVDKLGFNSTFVHWIASCVRSPWISPLVNGRPTSLFQCSRGLRQGCHLYHFLFIIMTKSLSHKLEGEMVGGNLPGIKIDKGIKSINRS